MNISGVDKNTLDLLNVLKAFEPNEDLEKKLQRNIVKLFANRGFHHYYQKFAFFIELKTSLEDKNITQLFCNEFEKQIKDSSWENFVKGFPTIIKHLLSMNIDINAEDKRSQTLLFHAIQ